MQAGRLQTQTRAKSSTRLNGSPISLSGGKTRCTALSGGRRLPLTRDRFAAAGDPDMKMAALAQEGGVGDFAGHAAARAKRDMLGPDRQQDVFVRP